jgi:uncharacterized protein YqeY
MEIKKLYKEAEMEKKNKVMDKKMYSMPLDKFIKEHKDLVEILREGSREELLAEAERQEEELEKCLKDHGMSAEEDEEEDDDE